jgi:hypothetical protein
MAATTYNPPPSWPTPPEGWSPPPGWQPDPEWPPAPDGWQLWVPTRPPRRGLFDRPLWRDWTLIFGVLAGLYTGGTTVMHALDGSGYGNTRGTLLGASMDVAITIGISLLLFSLPLALIRLVVVGLARKVSGK